MQDDLGRGAAVFEFSGAVTIRQIGDAWTRLCAAIEGAGMVTVDVSGVSACDLSFVQLLEAARKSCARRGGEIRLAAPASGSLLEVLHRGGFLPSDDTSRLEFWTHAGAAQ